MSIPGEARSTNLLAASLAAALVMLLVSCALLARQAADLTKVVEHTCCPSFRMCQTFGQLFAVDLLGGQMLVKGPSGDIDELLFDRATVFTRFSFLKPTAASAQIAPDAMNTGDWICSQVSGDNSEKRVSEVLVTSRAEIEERQKETLSKWVKPGVFGTVVELKSGGRSFTLEYLALAALNVIFSWMRVGLRGSADSFPLRPICARSSAPPGRKSASAIGLTFAPIPGRPVEP